MSKEKIMVQLKQVLMRPFIIVVTMITTELRLENDSGWQSHCRKQKIQLTHPPRAFSIYNNTPLPPLVPTDKSQNKMNAVARKLYWLALVLLWRSVLFLKEMYHDLWRKKSSFTSIYRIFPLFLNAGVTLAQCFNAFLVFVLGGWWFFSHHP